MAPPGPSRTPRHRHAVHLELHADLQVVVKVLANARQIVNDVHAGAAKDGSRSNTRSLEEMR